MLPTEQGTDTARYLQIKCQGCPESIQLTLLERFAAGYFADTRKYIKSFIKYKNIYYIIKMLYYKNIEPSYTQIATPKFAQVLANGFVSKDRSPQKKGEMVLLLLQVHGC